MRYIAGEWSGRGAAVCHPLSVGDASAAAVWGASRAAWAEGRCLGLPVLHGLEKGFWGGHSLGRQALPQGFCFLTEVFWVL